MTSEAGLHCMTGPKGLPEDMPLSGAKLSLWRPLVSLSSIYMASDRMRKKIKDYAEIFGHIMRKHALIMRKLLRIMRKLKQVIKLIIRPVQCIYMLTVNP